MYLFVWSRIEGEKKPAVGLAGWETWIVPLRLESSQLLLKCFSSSGRLAGITQILMAGPCLCVSPCSFASHSFKWFALSKERIRLVCDKASFLSVHLMLPSF